MIKPFSSQLFRFCSLLIVFGTTFNSQAADPMGAVSEWADSVRESTDGRINLSGYVNAHYMKHEGLPEFLTRDPNLPLVQIREASIFADVVITDNILFSTELETSYDFSDEEASGREDKFESLFNYYYMDLDIAGIFDWDTDEIGSVNIRAGRVLVPFLQYNENKPNFKQSLMSQPFTAWQLAPVNNVAASFKQFGWSDLGVVLDWSKDVGAGIVNIKTSAINGLGVDGPVLDTTVVTLNPPGMMKPTVRVRDGLHNARADWNDNTDSNGELAFSAKVSFAFFAMPLNIGVSWYSGAWDENEDHNLTMKGIHVDYIMPKWHIKGETVVADVEQTAGVDPVGVMMTAGINTSSGDYTMTASYIEGAYNVFEYGNSNKNYVKLIVRYDRVNTNDEVMFTPFNRSRNTIGLEWQFINNIKLRYESQRHTLEDFDNAPQPFIDAGGEETVRMNMLSIIANF
ncbi:MAG: hypothetical protein COA99_01685 [Moraxellaceae bacterium]|nr:MAG: hypothetical protein COA99_01685 [Moraxellaceae bacterium]